MVDILAESLVIDGLLQEAEASVLLFLKKNWSMRKEALRDGLITVVNEVVPAYGGAIASEYMTIVDKVRIDANLDDYDIPMPEFPEYDEISSRIRWAMSDAFSDDPNFLSVADRTRSVTMDLVQRAGRDVVFNTVGDKKSGLDRFARVLGSKDHCEACIMLASRGAVYKSAKSAKGFWHDQCACRPVPFHKTTEIDGYNPDELYDRWQNMVRERESKKNKS